MSEFKNMKILVENNLDDIVVELERRGYKKFRWGGFIDGRFNNYSIRTIDNGTFTDMKSKQVYCYGYELITLKELREMQL